MVHHPCKGIMPATSEGEAIHTRPLHVSTHMKVPKTATMGQSRCGPETQKGMTLRREGSSCLHPFRTL